MNPDNLLASQWLIFVLDPEQKDQHGWMKPLHAVAYGVDRAVEQAMANIPDGSYLLLVVCRDDNEARHVRVTIDRTPAITVDLV